MTYSIFKPTQERKFASSFTRSYQVPVEVTVLPSYSVTMKDGVPMVEIKDLCSTSSTFGMFLHYSLQDACNMGAAVYNEIGART